MILGRNAGLWAALVQSGLNVAAAIIVVATNQPLSPADVALFAALNAMGLAIVGVIANVADPTTLPTFAMTTSPPVAAGFGGTTALPTGSPTADPSGATPPAPGGGPSDGTALG